MYILYICRHDFLPVSYETDTFYINKNKRFPDINNWAPFHIHLFYIFSIFLSSFFFSFNPRIEDKQKTKEKH